MEAPQPTHTQDNYGLQELLSTVKEEVGVSTKRTVGEHEYKPGESTEALLWEITSTLLVCLTPDKQCLFR